MENQGEEDITPARGGPLQGKGEHRRSKVFVVDQERGPQLPVHPGYARWLLSHGKAALLHRAPFTLILKRVCPEMPPAPLRLKIDPGSRTTGLAVVDDEGGQVVWAAELAHRGEEVKHTLEQRRGVRRSRRQRHTRYRPPRFRNRKRTPGWQPPSRLSRVQNVLTWGERLRKRCPIGALSLELVRFDTQRLQVPEISGLEYQQGELAGYEVRQYLLEKWGRRCVYCGATNVPVQIEHVLPRSRGGSNRARNLTLACEPCNTAKGTRTAAEFGYPEVEAQAKQPLKDAAAVNATRWLLFEHLKTLGLSLETGTGGRTQWNRTRRGLPKTRLSGCQLCGCLDPGGTLLAAGDPLADHGYRTAMSPDVSGGQARVPQKQAEGTESYSWISDRGSSAGGVSGAAEDGWGACGPGISARGGLV